MLLTKSTTFIIGPVASLLGYIMNAIFWVQSQIGIESIGLCIIFIHRCDLHASDAADNQAAEVFQTAEQNESGAAGNSEKI